MSRHRTCQSARWFEVSETDKIFLALAHPARRSLVDFLTVARGRSMAELEDHLQLTRFAIMKHLEMLRAARIVDTQVEGKRHMHFLNPAPIANIGRNWIDRYALLSARLGRPDTPPDTQQYDIHIRATPTEIWAAMTSPEVTQKASRGIRVEGDWSLGGTITVRAPRRSVAEGRVLSCFPARLLSHTLSLSHPAQTAAEPPSRCVWRLKAYGAVTHLSLTHDDFPDGSTTGWIMSQFWPSALSSLKSLLETGEPLPLSQHYPA